MIIDYSRLKKTKMLFGHYGEIDGAYLEDKKNNLTDYVEVYGSKEEKEEYHVKRGIFSKPQKQTRTRTVKDETRKGVSIAAYSIDCEKGYAKSESAHGMLVIDNKTLMPAIAVPPTTIEEMVDLVSVDPRYVAACNPALVKSFEDVEKLKEAAVKGVETIFAYQASMGVASSEEELNEMQKYSDECSAAMAVFMRGYRQVRSNLEEIIDASKVKE